MTLRPIRTEADHEQALARIFELWGAEHGTPEGDELDVLGVLVHAWEQERFPVAPVKDPLEVIRYKIKERGLSQNRAAEVVGCDSGRFSEILRGKRPLTVALIRKISDGLGIPPGLLIAGDSGEVDEWIRLPADVHRIVAALAESQGSSYGDTAARMLRAAASAMQHPVPATRSGATDAPVGSTPKSDASVATVAASEPVPA